MKFSNPALFALTMLGSFNINLVQAGDLTLDFESGTLEGWTQTGDAFSYQPTKGDNPTARQRGQISNHQGEYWIGTYEKHQGLPGQDPGGVGGDGLQGTLTSKPFTISHDFSKLDFLVGGGGGCYVQLLVGGVVKREQGGFNHEEMRRVSWDIADLRGETGVLRMLDEQSGGWGHINVDDFRFVNDQGGVVVEGSIQTGGGASASGDPHFVTWGGNKFDFHGGCDLVLLQNPDFGGGLGMAIHVRTKISRDWSSIESVTVQIGQDTLEVKGSAKDGATVWINHDSKMDLQTGDSFLGDYPVHFKRVNDHHTITRIDIGDGDAVSIESFKNFIRVNTHNKSNKAFIGSRGLLGAYPTGEKVGRDGKTVFDNADEFGQEWQRLASEPNLFHTMEDAVEPHKKCPMPAISQSSIRRRLAEASVTEGDARVACARVNPEQRDACIFDVLATQDKDMVGSY